MCHVNIFRYKTHTELEKNSFPFIHLDNIYISFYFFFSFIFLLHPPFRQADEQDLFQAVYASVTHTDILRLEKQNSMPIKKLASKYCKRQYSLKN